MKLYFLYVDPEKNIFHIVKKYHFGGEVTDVWAKTKSVDLRISSAHI